MPFLHDKFIINGIDKYSPSELSVFNRWGEEVFIDKDYINTWEGKNNNGKDLVDDTYYYLLKINNGKVYKGYIILKR